jgi:cell division protein FtsQ
MRRRRNKKYKKIKYFLVFLWLFVCSIFGYFAPTIPVVKKIVEIKEVNVYGTDKLKKEDLKKIFSSQNWFFLKTDKIEKELKSYPFVKDVYIERLFVGKVNLKILERKPFAVLKFKNKKYIIDNDGIILNREFYNKKEIKNLKVYVVLNDKKFNKERLKEIYKIYNTFNKLKIKKYIVNMSQITCVLDDNKVLVFSTEDLDKSIRRAMVFLKKKDINKFSYLNFSFDSIVVARR